SSGDAVGSVPAVDRSQLLFCYPTIADLVRCPLVCPRPRRLDVAGVRHSSLRVSLRTGQQNWKAAPFHRPRRSSRLPERRQKAGHAAGGERSTGDHFLWRVRFSLWNCGASSLGRPRRWVSLLRLHSLRDSPFSDGGPHLQPTQATPFASPLSGRSRGVRRELAPVGLRFRDESEVRVNRTDALSSCRLRGAK